MADDVLSMLPSQVQRRHANDWTNYEAMLPRPSHSKAGLHDECVRTTVPFVRTILRASAHEKTTTSAADPPEPLKGWLDFSTPL